MRSTLSAVLLLLAVAGCNRDSSPALAASTAPVNTSPPAPALPPAPAIPKVSTWTLDAENSSVGFVCKHVLTNVRGMFQRPTGTATFDERTLKVEAAIDPKLISTGVDERDAHLRGQDFFDVAKFPVITFASTGSSKTSDTAFSVTGNLTLHGVTKPVTLAVTVTPPFNHAGGIRRGIEATTSVNRRDFGLQWDFPGEGTGVVVGDVIKVNIDAELVLQP